MDLYKKHRKAKGLYGLCAAMCPETYHHWKVFTGGGSGGACVVLKRAPLEEYLDAIEMPEVTNVRYEEVEYLDLTEARALKSKDRARLPFLKRIGFADEQEYRIVIETNTAQDSSIYIDCPVAWIDRIYLNPSIPKQQAQSVIIIFKSIPGCKIVDIRRSFLIDSSTWKNAGDRVAGEKETKKLKLVAKPSSVKLVAKPARLKRKVVA